MGEVTLCKDCRWYRGQVGPHASVCMRPENIVIDPVEGTEWVKRCSAMRGDGARCGPDGLLFEKPPRSHLVTAFDDFVAVIGRIVRRKPPVPPPCVWSRDPKINAELTRKHGDPDPQAMAECVRIDVSQANLTEAEMEALEKAVAGRVVEIIRRGGI